MSCFSREDGMLTISFFQYISVQQVDLKCHKSYSTIVKRIGSFFPVPYAPSAVEMKCLLVNCLICL